MPNVLQLAARFGLAVLRLLKLPEQSPPSTILDRFLEWFKSHPVSSTAQPVVRISMVIRPADLESLCAVLQDYDIWEHSITEAKGYGRTKGHTEVYRGSEYTVDFLPKTIVVLYTTPEMADALVKHLGKVFNNGKIGAGKIWVEAAMMTDISKHVELPPERS